MTVGDLIQQLANIDPHIDVFFRKTPPVAGNLVMVVKVDETHFNFFGVPMPCVVLETYDDEGDDDVV